MSWHAVPSQRVKVANPLRGIESGLVRCGVFQGFAKRSDLSLQLGDFRVCASSIRLLAFLVGRRRAFDGSYVV